MATKYTECKKCLVKKTTRHQQRSDLCRKCSDEIRLYEKRFLAAQLNRVCIRCKIEKPNTEEYFYYHTKSKLRLKTCCKDCDDNRKNKWNKEHPELKSEQSKKTYDKYREEYSIKRKLKRKTTTKVREYFRKYYKEYNKIPKNRIRNNISGRIREAIKEKGKTKNGGATFKALGYSPEQLAEHLEKQFDANMSWDNYGTYWHIDHIVPHSHFNYDSLEHPEFKKCWALDNLRPLEAIENIRKGNKLID